MTNILIEGFDTYPVGAMNAAPGNPWNNTTGSNFISVSTVTPITGTRSLRVENGSGTAIQRALGGSHSELYVGVAYVPETLTGANLNFTPVGFHVASATRSVFWYINGLGQVSLGVRSVSFSGSGGVTLIYTSDVVYPVGVKMYVEMRVSQESVTLVVNGVNLTTVNLAVAPGPLSSIGIGERIGPYGRYDDIYVNSATGANNNSFWGETAVMTMFPTADLPSAPAMTTVGAANAAAALRNVPPLTTQYVEATAAGQLQNLNMPDLPPDVFQVFTVQTVYRAQKTAVGLTEVRSAVTQNGAAAVGAAKALTENTYAFYTDNFPIDPDTGLAWNVANFKPKLRLERVT